MKVCCNFLVCKEKHYTRTHQLYKVFQKQNSKQENKASIFLFGGFLTFDNIPVIKSSQTDDYYSCIDKMFEIFKHHRKASYDWYFIGDDDTYVNLHNLLLLIEKLPTKNLQVYGYIDLAPTIYGTILHAHGGSGILFNKQTYIKILKFLDKTNFSMRHTIFSDVTLAINIHQYNTENAETPILFTKVNEMSSPHLDINTLDVSKIVTIHTKDKISLENLYKQQENIL